MSKFVHTTVISLIILGATYSNGALADTATFDSAQYSKLCDDAKALYQRGASASTDDARVGFFNQGIEKATAAKALAPQFADAYYAYSLNLNGLLQTQGWSRGQSHKAELIDQLRATIARKTIDARPGESIDGYSPDRMLGHLLYALPLAAGGSRARAIEILNQSYRKAPDNALNGLALADALSDGEALERARAKGILAELMSKPERLSASNRDHATELLKVL